MPVDPAPEPAHRLTLPYLDPVGLEVTQAIHTGDLDALRHLLSARPELASARMIGRKGTEGGWRTPLHAATDWPGYFPSAREAVVMLLEAGADPNDDSGGEGPETPLHWAASTDDVEVAVALIDGGAHLEIPGGSIGTQLDNAIGYGCGLPDSSSSAARRSEHSGTPLRSECSRGSTSCSPPLRHPLRPR